MTPLRAVPSPGDPSPRAALDHTVRAWQRGRMRSIISLVVAVCAFAAPALAQGGDEPPRLLSWGGPTSIACCRSAPTDADGFSYRASRGTERVTIAIQKRRCGTCAWREVGRYSRRPPQPGILPARLYRGLKIGSYRAWARAENDAGKSPRRFHRFRIVPLDD